MVRNLPAMQETQVQSLGQKIPWRRKWQPTPVFFFFFFFPLQYSCLETSIARGAWQDTVYGVAKSRDTTKRLTHKQGFLFLMTKYIPNRIRDPPNIFMNLVGKALSRRIDMLIECRPRLLAPFWPTHGGKPVLKMKPKYRKTEQKRGKFLVWNIIWLPESSRAPSQW